MIIIKASTSCFKNVRNNASFILIHKKKIFIVNFCQNFLSNSVTGKCNVHVVKVDFGKGTDVSKTLGEGIMT